MYEELKEIGLTDGEIKVYLALLKLGPSTNSPISKQTSLQNSSVYYCLNSLIEKGFVSYIIKKNRKNYIATEPENIFEILEEKEKELNLKKSKIKNIIPELEEIKKKGNQETKAEVFEGFNGFQMIFRQILQELKKGDTYRAFAIEQTLGDPNKLKLFFTSHNKELKRRGIKLKLLASQNIRPAFEKIYGKRHLKTYLEIRYTNELTPTGITIYNNKVITHINDDEKPTLFKITNKTLSQNYNNYFDAVWEKSKKN